MTKLTTADVAERLNVSPTRVIQLVQSGKLTSLTKKKRGQLRRPPLTFDSVDVELFMAKKNDQDKKLTPLPKMPRKEKPVYELGIQQQLNIITDLLNKILTKLR